MSWDACRYSPISQVDKTKLTDVQRPVHKGSNGVLVLCFHTEVCAHTHTLQRIHLNKDSVGVRSDPRSMPLF